MGRVAAYTPEGLGVILAAQFYFIKRRKEAHAHAENKRLDRRDRVYVTGANVFKRAPKTGFQKRAKRWNLSQLVSEPAVRAPN